MQRELRIATRCQRVLPLLRMTRCLVLKSPSLTCLSRLDLGASREQPVDLLRTDRLVRYQIILRLGGQRGETSHEAILG